MITSARLTLRSLGCDPSNEIMLEQARCTLAATELKVALRAEGRVGSNGNAEQLAIVDKGVLGQVRVDFDLEDLGLNSSVAVNVVNEGAWSIAAIIAPTTQPV